MKQSALQRINRVLKYYLDRGKNSERANKVYRNILKIKFKDYKYYENQFKPKDYGRTTNN